MPSGTAPSDPLALRLRRDGTIVILTGAGISKESGLDTFRDPDGIWQQVSIDQVATPEAFLRDPDLVHRFYNDRRRQLVKQDVRPNAAHDALVRLERAWPGEVLLVTQNVDDLHDRAGSTNLIHMHGELLKVRCEACQGVVAEHGPIGRDSTCAGCGAIGRMRPHVVWFGEMPFQMERIYETLSRCALFVSIGTSGTVYPAAGFVQAAVMDANAYAVELNLEATETSGLFSECRNGPATRLVPEFVDRVLALA